MASIEGVKVIGTLLVMSGIIGRMEIKGDMIVAIGGGITVPSNMKNGNARAGCSLDSNLANFVISDLLTWSGIGGKTVAIYDGIAHGHWFLDGIASMT